MEALMDSTCIKQRGYLMHLLMNSVPELIGGKLKLTNVGVQGQSNSARVQSHQPASLLILYNGDNESLLIGECQRSCKPADVVISYCDGTSSGLKHLIFRV